MLNYLKQAQALFTIEIITMQIILQPSTDTTLVYSSSGGLHTLVTGSILSLFLFYGLFKTHLNL